MYKKGYFINNIISFIDNKNHKLLKYITDMNQYSEAIQEYKLKVTVEHFCHHFAHHYCYSSNLLHLLTQYPFPLIRDDAILV